MNPHPNPFLLPGLTIVALLILATAGLWYWGRKVARAHGGGRWHLVQWIPVMGLLLVVAGVATFVALALPALKQLSGAIDPALKSQVLADGIAEAINYSVLFGVPAALLYLAAIVLCVVGFLRPPQ